MTIIKQVSYCVYHSITLCRHNVVKQADCSNSCIVQVSQVYLLLTTGVKCNISLHKNIVQSQGRGQYTHNPAVTFKAFHLTRLSRDSH